MKYQTIGDFLSVAPKMHDLDWLISALQCALQLELATLPPYLFARWSIDADDPNAAYPIKSLSEITIEEMVHMGTVCNLLTTLGVTPRINAPDLVPRFPGPLPAGVKPGLMVALVPLSPRQLEVFMSIEEPEHPIEASLLTADGKAMEKYATIGAFYDAILGALSQLPPDAFTGKRQISYGSKLRPISTASAAAEALILIKSQGEGTSMSPEQDLVAQNDLAHFYRFRELKRERRFEKVSPNEWRDGSPLPMPKVRNVAIVPAGGYAESEAFDRLYSRLLDLLQAAWETGDTAVFGRSIARMYELEEEAIRLMETPIDPNDPQRGNFGPSFIYYEAN